jgi:hypothetical protein
MVTAQPKQISLRWCRRWRAIGFWPAFAVALICLGPLGPFDAAAQQPATGIYAAGDAAVTGFSGALPPVQIAPGADPGEQTFIDANGASMRVVDLRHMGGPATAQLVGAPKPVTVTAAQVGQVFGVALDDNTPPNIYVAASSAYGLPIVATGPDGKPKHIKLGAANAAFMNGLWGPGPGGPGSIWKIDGATAQATLLANVNTDGRANSGAALGGLAFDPDSKSLFVADRESGLIHRFALDGSERGRFDHGVAGRAAQTLPPVPGNTQRIDIKSPKFNSEDPATWNYAAPPRRVFGLAVHEHRLYYAVADSLQVWSVGLKPDGAFDTDAVIELEAPPAAGPTEISKITFDEQGRMYLADRADPTGAFDMEALAVPAIGRVLRYAVVNTMEGGRHRWQQKPDEYAIGFPTPLRNGNGGVAIGYRYDKGEINLASCGGFMWTTGEDLRHSPDPELAAALKQTGTLDVTGLQGNGTWLTRRVDTPPLESYFVDYADKPADAAARGYMGDIAIARQCTPPQRAELLPINNRPRRPPPDGPPSGGTPPGGTPPGGNPPPPTGSCPPLCDNVPPPSSTCPPVCGPPPVSTCPPGEMSINGRCCSPNSAVSTGNACSNSSCPSGQIAIGPSNFCCPGNQVYTNSSNLQVCCPNIVINGKCANLPPPVRRCLPGSRDPNCCPDGYTSTGTTCCLTSQMTSTGTCCPTGQIPSGPNKGQCKPIVRLPPKFCCASGLVPTANRTCCAPANLTSSGICCGGPVDPKNRATCPPRSPVTPPTPACASGYTRVTDGTCCNNRFLSADGQSCGRRTPSGNVPPPPSACPRGQTHDVAGNCVKSPPSACPRGQTRDGDGDCVTSRPSACPRGQTRDGDGDCVTPPPAPCPPGQIRDGIRGCVLPPPPCPRGMIRRFGQCVYIAPPRPDIGPPRWPGRPPGGLRPGVGGGAFRGGPGEGFHR